MHNRFLGDATMCLAVPGKLIERDGHSGTVDVRGNRVQARLDVVPDVRLGDYVLVHAGFAISVLSDDEAAEALDLLDDLDEAMPHDGPLMP